MIIERLYEDILTPEQHARNEDIDLLGCYYTIALKADQSESPVDPRFAKAWWEVPNNSLARSNST